MQCTFTMYPGHVFSMCPVKSVCRRFKCLHDVPTRQTFVAKLGYILYVPTDLIMVSF